MRLRETLKSSWRTEPSRQWRWPHLPTTAPRPLVESGFSRKSRKRLPEHSPVKGEDAECAVVAGVVAILPVADRLAADLQKVLAPLPGQVVAIVQLVVDRAADGGAGADAAEAVAEDETD